MRTQALEALLRLKGFGVSYASKHLMMLQPANCATLDSRVASLGYSENSAGYEKWCDDCYAVTIELEQRGLTNPRLDNQPIWRVADIDATIFASLMGWYLPDVV